jgi:hypothetical protein
MVALKRFRYSIFNWLVFNLYYNDNFTVRLFENVRIRS